MNKLPWFTHDNDAHHDLDLRKVMQKHGGLKAYGLWWLLLEILDLHGQGDRVEVAWSDIEKWGLTRRSYAQKVVDTLCKVGLIQCTHGGSPQGDPGGLLKVTRGRPQGYLVYEIKNFRERKWKLKFKPTSNLPQTFLKPPIQVQEQRDNRSVVLPLPPQICGQPKARLMARKPFNGLRPIRDVGRELVEYVKRAIGGNHTGEG